jgi:hypothetical protein
MFDLDDVPLQGKLDVGMPDPDLTDVEKELAETVEAAINVDSVTTNKVVVVAISSSPMGLHAVSWGEARLAEGGHLEWAFSEDLADVAAPGPVGAVDSRKTFTTGELPKKELRHRSEPDQDSGIPASDDD